MTTTIRNIPVYMLALILVLGVLTGCVSPQDGENGSETGSAESGKTQGSKNQVRLILGAYTTPREAYGKLIPIFQQQWKEKTGQEVIFEESYLGSGAQSRAVVEGFEADVVALSLEADVTRIQKAGLITRDWKANPSRGMVSNSLVVFVVREGNPKGIRDWHDLAQTGLEILTPNPKTSGGAMWNILSLYGAASRGFVEGVEKDDQAAAQAFLLAVLNNVMVMDKGARESITNFEKGIGDVAITYENEVLVGQQNGEKYQMVIPRSSILIENPVAVVDQYVDKHGSREVAEAFVEFLFSQEAQEIFAQYGLRSINQVVARATSDQYPAIQDQFSIEYFGGWEKAMTDYFGENGIYNQTIAKTRNMGQ